MTFIIGSVILSALFIMISKVPLAMAMARQKEGYDNSTPRAQQANLDNSGKRALGAHQNCIEAFPLFAAGVLLALWGSADIETVQYLCGAFIFARTVYLASYLLNLDKLRSTVWGIGFISSIWLMALALP
jgi:uncharacterized MAPEG superfamily protein